MKLILSTLLFISCSANLVNRTVGYKEYPLELQSKHIAVLEEPNINVPKVTIEDKPDIVSEYKKRLKKAIQVSIANSGHFSNVVWKEEKSEITDETVYIEINFTAIEDKRIGYYTYYPVFFFLYLPFGENEEKGEKIFWSTLIPGFWPASGYYPLLAKSGTVTVEVEYKIIQKNKDPIIVSSKKIEDYRLLFYGVYRTAEVEEKSILAIENALEELSLKIADLELEGHDKPIQSKSIEKMQKKKK